MKAQWRLMTARQRERELERQKRWRQRRYASDPAYRARMQARLIALVARRGGNTKPGPSGWPIG
jgi:hypothetical protein